jgi:acyl-[acyl-carrier-protein] desaturase
MTYTFAMDSPQLQARIYALFRDYFDKAEKKRRWNIREDIDWDQCNPNLSPALADVVQTFCSVELFLPDYLSKLITQVRNNRGRAWFLANWGYEECKHSMALGDWLQKSGQRSDEQMWDMEQDVFNHEYNLVTDDPRRGVVYTMMQELATWVHYQNLRKLIGQQDPTLHRVLTLIAIDERAHYDFFKRLVSLYLEEDRPGMLEHIRHVANTFAMPAYDLLTDSRKRMNDVQELKLFDSNIYLYQVLEPVLADLNVTRKELRKRKSLREIAVMGTTS